ncbi:pseudouridine synthase [Thamnidium elegans]|nr:pseudouridine synthase [Thamnidium elegans]
MNQFIPLRRSLFTSIRLFDRIKTAKDRKEHFLKVNSWKANQSEYEPVNEDRKPKKKVALLLGYNGSGYQGMQANPGTKSIEEELFNALVKVEAISKSNSIDPKKVQLMRAARTDKGVHASCNLISLKMICQDKDLVEKLNAQLPNCIRIWGYVETQRTFHAKTKCDSRIYEYLLPSYTLKRLVEKKLKLEPESERDYKILTENGTMTRYISPTDQSVLSNFRVDQERLEKFKAAMSLFKGTHNFHNYTISRSFKDPASKRFMIDISVNDPMIIENTEWISVKLHGQSFMLHQIRKMISMAMLSVRTGTPLSLIPKTFEADKINIPKAPALGLLLERPVFQLYNNRMASVENRNSIDFDIYKNQIETFKKEFIYKEIFEHEKKNREFDTFLAAIDSHIDSTYQYFNTEGVIPEQCILKTKYSVQNNLVNEK